jgi:hypothetical protein
VNMFLKLFVTRATSVFTKVTSLLGVAHDGVKRAAIRLRNADSSGVVYTRSSAACARLFVLASGFRDERRDMNGNELQLLFKFRT